MLGCKDVTMVYGRRFGLGNGKFGVWNYISNKAVAVAVPEWHTDESYAKESVSIRWH